MARILLIDNDKTLRRSLAQALQGKGHETSEADDGRDAIENLKLHNYALIITEVLLTDLDAGAVLAYLEENGLQIPVIALSGGNSQIPAEMALLMVKAQVTATLVKPVTEADITALAEKLLTEAAAA